MSKQSLFGRLNVLKKDMKGKWVSSGIRVHYKATVTLNV